ncbi:DUF1304 domain-containing protein [Archangium violaceum]|jgi:putative membrane protein|uniref:DUF1304 domain-containing protein n=1 Tax=Archangium violaceum TaxID=83451 RepID=UPI001950E1D2|nr:DUF1304 domain-containing protein [Archangium violaceum]QRN97015.1 DUF1304 domain-containing protein [Archangium violaceum]
MKMFANLMVGLVALLHVGFMVLEMFFWDHDVGAKVFGLSREVLHSSATLAANQGLYNGILAAGLAWALATGKRDVKLFLLGCVVVAGIFGAFTAKLSILFTQALPAVVALVLVLLSTPKAQAA